VTFNWCKHVLQVATFFKLLSSAAVRADVDPGCRTSDGGPMKRADVEIKSLFSPIGVDCGPLMDQ
jgi:hypothetical protein